MNELSIQMLLFLAGFGVFVAFGVAVVYKMALGMVPEHDKSNVAKEVIPLVAIGVIVAAIYALAVAGLVKENTVAAIFGALGVCPSNIL